MSLPTVEKLRQRSVAWEALLELQSEQRFEGQILLVEGMHLVACSQAPVVGREAVLLVPGLLEVLKPKPKPKPQEVESLQ